MAWNPHGPSRRSGLQPGASRADADPLEDRAPPSLYDAPDDAPEDFADDGDPIGPDQVGSDRVGPDRADDRAAPAPGCWRAAVAACPAALAEAAAGFARLDERLRIMAPPERTAARERLATLQASRLLWGVGAFVPPEAVTLDALDRRGRADENAPAITAARRLARMLARPAPRAGADLGASAPDDAALRDAPPLVAAALAPRPGGAASEIARLEAAAVRLTLAARAGRGGAVFAPVPARRRAGGLAPHARLAAFLGDVADGARDALALLDDLAAWRARADAAAAGMKGGSPARMIALLACRPAVSAPDAAAALRLSDDAALRVLARLARDGLARELTGHSRFRVWAARL